MVDLQIKIRKPNEDVEIFLDKSRSSHNIKQVNRIVGESSVSLERTFSKNEILKG